MGVHDGVFGVLEHRGFFQNSRAVVSKAAAPNARVISLGLCPVNMSAIATQPFVPTITDNDRLRIIPRFMQYPFIVIGFYNISHVD